jgi:hypothetical protein
MKFSQFLPDRLDLLVLMERVLNLEDFQHLNYQVALVVPCKV